MATRLVALANSSCRNGLPTLIRSKTSLNTLQKRQVTTATQIPIPAEPIKKKFSTPKALTFIALGVFVGQYAAKKFAAFMEETELFVPDDDDD